MKASWPSPTTASTASSNSSRSIGKCRRAPYADLGRERCSCGLRRRITAAAPRALISVTSAAPCGLRRRVTEQIRLVQDNLSTHTPASLYAAFPAPEARRLAKRFEWHYTPKHGSWLDMAE